MHGIKKQPLFPVSTSCAPTWNRAASCRILLAERQPWGQADVARQTSGLRLEFRLPPAGHQVDFRLLKVHSAPTSKSLGEELSQVLGACQPLIDHDTGNGEARSRRSQR